MMRDEFVEFNSKRCARCKEKAATGKLAWYAWLPWLFIAGPNILSGNSCDDCAGGMEFVGGLFTLVLAIAAFVVVVIVW